MFIILRPKKTHMKKEKSAVFPQGICYLLVLNKENRRKIKQNKKQNEEANIWGGTGDTTYLECLHPLSEHLGGVPAHL